MSLRCGVEPVKMRDRKVLALSHVWPSGPVGRATLEEARGGRLVGMELGESGQEARRHCAQSRALTCWQGDRETRIRLL